MTKYILAVVAACIGLLLTSGCGAAPAPTIAQTQPITVIQSPPSNSEYHAGEMVAVQSTSTDNNNKIVRVELAVDGVVVRTDAPPQPQASFSVLQTWTATEGQHMLAVRAFNSANQAGLASQIAIHVLPTGTPSAPVPTVVTPGSGFTPAPAPTALPVNTPPPPPVAAPIVTPTPAPTRACDSAAFVVDVTVPDGTRLATGQDFNKIWRIRNTGTCAWGTGYALVFVSGTMMAGAPSIAVPPTAPGATGDLLVPMTAPATPGVYVSNWRLQNARGQLFGVTVFAKIDVISPAAPAPTAVPTATSGCPFVPVIESFTASPATITAGESATLSWGLVISADRAEIDNGIGGVATPGSTTVSPTTTTTYTMTATCGAKVTTAQVTITVNAP